MGNLSVADNEWLARYILRKDHVRADGTVKPDPFIPFKHVELSVTRHLGLSESDLWAAGETVATQVGEDMYGRADAIADVFVRQKLKVLSAPVVGNVNHANVVGWPPDKKTQKEIALLIAREAAFKPKA